MPTTAMSWSYWAKRSAGIWTQALVSKREPNYGGYVFVLKENVSSDTRHWVNTTGIANNPGWASAATQLYPTGAWVHVAVVFSESYVSAYLDGSYAGGEATQTGDLFPSGTVLRFGANTDPGATQYYHGEIDDVRYFDRALTTDEIQTLYSAGR